jgi:hypothetical protein
MGFFIDKNEVIWTLRDDGTNNYRGEAVVTNDGESVIVNDGLITAEYRLWETLQELALFVEVKEESFSLDAIREDLLHQLKIPDELDWCYFFETAGRALLKAEADGLNMRR